jgi:hypothetical protein
MMELKSQTIRNQSPQRRLQAATQDAQALTNELCRFSANLKTTGLQWSGISLTCFNLRSPSIPSLTWHFSHLALLSPGTSLTLAGLVPTVYISALSSLSLLFPTFSHSLSSKLGVSCFSIESAHNGEKTKRVAAL